MLIFILLTRNSINLLMKSVWLFCLVGVIIVACNKASAPTPAGTIPPTIPPADTTVAKDTVVTTPPPPTFDSTALVESNWIAYRDSIVNVNYDGADGGYPIPGVIHNRAGDYWNFLPNGVLDAVINGTSYTTTYSYTGTNQITIATLPAGYTKPCTITTLTASTFIFYCADTSSLGGGGTYYRQVWLKK
jgi:hypothetical protein